MTVDRRPSTVHRLRSALGRRLAPDLAQALDHLDRGLDCLTEDPDTVAGGGYLAGLGELIEARRLLAGD